MIDFKKLYYSYFPVLIFLFLFIIVLFLSYFYSSEKRDNLTQNIINNTEMNAQVLGSRTSSLLDSIDLIILSISELIDLVGEQIPASVQKMIRQKLMLYPQIVNLTILDSKADILWQSPFPTNNFDLYRGIYRNHKEKSLSFSINYGAEMDHNHIIFSRSINSETNELEHIVMGEIDLNSVFAYDDQQIMHSFSRIIFLDKEFDILLQYENTEMSEELPELFKMARKDFLDKNIFSIKGGVFSFIDNNQILSFYQLQSFPFFVAVETNLSTELNLWYKNSRIVIIILSFVFLISFTGVYYLNFQRLLKIAELKKSENLLRGSERLLAESQKVANLGSWEYNLEAGTVIWSDQLFKIFGRDIDEGVPDRIDFIEFCHPHDRAQLQKNIEMLFQREISCVFRIIREDNGEERWLYSQDKIEKNDKGNAIRISGIIHDITESKRAENEKILHERQSQNAQKMESLGVLAGGIAHDFNNILMGVIGYAELTLSELPIESPIREYLTSIVSASMRANELIKQILAYSGNGHFHMEPMNINSMIKGITQLLQAYISRNVVLKFNFSESIPSIKADINQIRQVFVNLITNASEALEEKSGIITISTGVMKITEEYRREIFVNDDLSTGYYSFFEVNDMGCGMDRETQSKIFDPFFTTKFPGRGLGLAATLGIVRGHKGAIKVCSESGKGTTFKVLFPCSDHEYAKQSDNDINDSSPQGNDITITMPING